MDPVIRTRQDAYDAVEVYSPAEQQFNRRRRLAGLVIGPLVALALLAAPLGLSAPARNLAAIMALMCTFWITEALPVAVTALLGPLLVVVGRVAPMKEAFAPFADPIIFLFLGSFMLAEAMYVQRLDRRLAFLALASSGASASPTRIIVVFGAVAAALSMWISNTATAAMLYPIGLAVVTHVAGRRGADGPRVRRFAAMLMLVIAFGASIGGIATPVGTPPNLIGIGMLKSLAGVEIGFARWMVFGVPIAAVLFLAMSGWSAWRGRGLASLPAAGSDYARRELAALGAMTRGERLVVAAFGLTVALWVFPGLLAAAGVAQSALARAFTTAIPESAAALCGALLLFLVPVDLKRGQFALTWGQASRIDWGTILLFGGGLSMGSLAFSTGLADAIGRGLASRLPADSTLAYTALFTALAIILSETTSNTAAATMLVPVAIAVSTAGGVRPVEPALGVTLGASMGFMLPISTPPNAIAYSSGYVPITVMMTHGLLLDVVGFLVIVVAVTVGAPLLF